MRPTYGAYRRNTAARPPSGSIAGGAMPPGIGTSRSPELILVAFVVGSWHQNGSPTPLCPRAPVLSRFSRARPPSDHATYLWAEDPLERRDIRRRFRGASLRPLPSGRGSFERR